MRKSMQESNGNAKIRKNAQNANSDFKYKRILQLYTRLLKGEVINKAKEAAAANVTERSIQRDLDDLRVFLMSRQQMEKIPMSLYTAVKSMAIFYIQKKHRPLQTVKCWLFAKFFWKVVHLGKMSLSLCFESS